MTDIGTIMLETDRLILRRVEVTDADEMFNNWCCDDVVTRYLPWDSHKNIDVTRKLLDMWVNEYKNDYVYRWIVVLKENRRLIGTIDVVNKDISNEVFEIGYCYSRDSWGTGIATEALSRIIRFLFEEVGVFVIVAKHYENNFASGKVMQKAGMKYDGMLRSRIIDKVTKERVGQVYYSITKTEYLEIK